MTDRPRDSLPRDLSGRRPDQLTSEPTKQDACDETFICTSCPRIGRPCPSALAALRELDRAGTAACGAAPDFEMTGLTRLTGCGQTCPAVFQMSAGCVTLYCGVEAGADMAGLRQFARAFLNAEAGAPLCAPAERPLAIAASGVARPAPAPARLC